MKKEKIGKYFKELEKKDKKIPKRTREKTTFQIIKKD